MRYRPHYCPCLLVCSCFPVIVPVVFGHTCLIFRNMLIVSFFLNGLIMRRVFVVGMFFVR